MKSSHAPGFLKAMALAMFSLIVSMSPSNTHAQAKALITTRVDETKLIQLKGNVPARIKGAKDLGLADASQPSGRLMLVLKRSDEQETALQSFLLTAHQNGSANFHKWLAPGEFGKKFGASDSDVQQLTAWLQSHGFQVAGTSGSQNTIEFSGNIGQVNEAFHTTIHKYSVKDAKSGALETHYSNASDPQVPAAFSAAVAGVTHLDDFRPKPQVKMMGQAKYDAKKHTGVPQWTVPGGFAPGTPIYFLAPEDFATQYDVKPVYAAGIDGAGQTIGIINDSNVDLSLVNAYRKLFNLPLNPPQVVIDGDDPGINPDSVEAYLDVENAGAVAPAATVKLYIAGNFGLLGDGGLNFALLRAVNDDAASVLSVSFGGCEYFGGTANNEFIGSLWEEAAAQGQTVLVSTGDSGSFDGCVGVGSNSLASTPWDVAVGGTDAYFSDYATGGASISTFWSDKNDASLGSLQTKFAEQPWNGTQYGLNSITYDPVVDQPFNTGAGGGGASSCVVSTLTAPYTYTCISGWPKPSWQVGVGVPADGVRDLPDVSLFASNGYNGIVWPICQEAGDCSSSDPNSGDLYVTGIGGTSASTPAMAGVMALINQKYGPQGQANYVLYPMAAQFPAAFNDITVGSNNEPCYADEVAFEVGCAADPVGGGYSLQGYSAGVGYDQATGLGTIDVNQLFTNWGKITFKTSGTTLSLSPTTFTHGTSVAASVAVAGTGTPSGSVALLANTTLVNNKSVTNIALSNGVGSTTMTNLPGGTYTVTADYSGDGINAASVSTPVTVTVSPEASTLQFSPQYGDPNTFNPTPVTAGSTVPFNSALLLDVQIAGATGTVDATATGTVTFKDGTAVLGTASISAEGTAEFNAASLAVGPHTVSASYSGDASFSASTSAPVQFNVARASVSASIFLDFTATHNSDYTIYYYTAGQSANVTGLVDPPIAHGGPCPTGTLTFQLGSGAPVVSTLAACENLQFVLGSTATAAFSNLQVGTYTLTMTYAGDANYTGTVATQVVEVTAATLLPTTTTVVTTPSDLSTVTPSTPIKVAITVAGNGTLTPTGTVILSLASFLYFDPVTLTPNGDGTATGTLSFRATDLFPGPNLLIATYSGDTNYSGSVSKTLLALDDPTDFTMQSSDTTTTVAAGSTASIGVTFTSLSGFDGSVKIGCTIPAGLLCTPSVLSIALNGSASAAVAINTVTTVPAPISNNSGGAGWMRTGAGTVMACLLFFVLPKRRRLGRAVLSALVMMVTLSAAGCGGGKPAGPTTVSTDAKPGTYTALIYGTGSNGIQHNVPVTIIVK